MRQRSSTTLLALVGAAALGAAAPLAAQSNGDTGGASSASAMRQAQATRLEGTGIVLDGRLDEAAWASAPALTDFVQMRPTPGQPASQPTEARLLYDDDAIYVGMRLYDDPDSIAAQLARRDASNIYTDWAHVLIDSYNDNRTAFRFSVTPKGSKKDVLHYDDWAEDLNWDAVWEVATAVDEQGWIAEFRIPLSQLRFSSSTSEDQRELIWGVNLGREIARSGEWAWWSPVLPNAGGTVSQAGELRGLTRLRAPRRLELLPYSVARLTRAPGDAADPFWSENAASLDAGLDLRYGITSNLTLSATINPDFGQVEADPSVVNLSAFESFFPEKRPFFIEGSNMFQFGVGTDDGSGEGLFYSRRIGRAPQRFVAAAGYVDAPDATTILGAAKLSGKTASGWQAGFLDALTAEEDADIALDTGERQVEIVEPMSNYAIGTLSRDFREGSSTIGALFTATNRMLDGRSELSFLRSAAYTGGVRARHRFYNNTWEASGYVAGSHIRGSADAIARVQTAAGHYFQRPDADHLEYDPTRTSLSGALGNLWIGRFAGGNILGGFGAHVRTPGLELNDLGFQFESDQILTFASWRYVQFEPRWIFRSFGIGVNPSFGWTTGGEPIWAQFGSWTNWELKNFWNGGSWFGLRPGTMTTGAARGGPAIVREANFQGNVWLNSDRRKQLTGHLSVGGGREQDTGAWNAFVGGGASYRPSPQLNLSLSPSLSRNGNTWQYVTQRATDDERHYIFGEIDQTTFSLTTRLNYTLSPTLSLELYAQPFVSGAEYDRFRKLSDTPRADRFEDRFISLDGSRIAYIDGEYQADVDADGTFDVAFGDPDFNFRQMRGNAVLRWEYLPGSTLYLVWSQSRTGFVPGTDQDPMFELGRDMRRLFNRDDAFPTPVTNVFLLKLSYWLNP
ncbi:MAG: DUF5916 domain-containing protein [Longimicrobiales bacterium]